ncbi:MAG: FKBP-type peptidyl-prolyl cis-trans isomerase [Gemmatimonadota bacterium]
MLGIESRARLGALALAFAVVAGCGDDGGPEMGTGTPENTTFSSILNVDLAQMTRLDGGLYIQDLRVGTGAEASVGDGVQMGYTGWLPDGTLFDGGTISFSLGQGRVIQGWERGIPGMRVGGLRKLVIPASLGYGNQGIGPIPPNSVLVFDVELLQIVP